VGGGDPDQLQQMARLLDQIYFIHEHIYNLSQAPYPDAQQLDMLNQQHKELLHQRQQLEWQINQGHLRAPLPHMGSMEGDLTFVEGSQQQVLGPEFDALIPRFDLEAPGGFIY
jgi:hypothetical protein